MEGNFSRIIYVPFGPLTWSGIASGSGATIEVTFDSDCQNQALTASLAGISKSVTIDVITPSIASMKFKNNFPIYDPSTGSAFPFAGYDSYPSATRNELKSAIALEAGMPQKSG